MHQNKTQVLILIHIILVIKVNCIHMYRQGVIEFLDKYSFKNKPYVLYLRIQKKFALTIMSSAPGVALRKHSTYCSSN